MDLDLLFLPIFNPRTTSPPPLLDLPLVVGHFGIPDVKKGCDTLIEACRSFRNRVRSGWCFADGMRKRLLPGLPNPKAIRDGSR